MENNKEVSELTEYNDFLSGDDYGVQFTHATQGQRFANWLIDNILMRFALSYLTGMAVGLLINMINPDFLNRIIYEGERSIDFILLGLMIGYLNYIVYYTLCEKLFKGYTLGKIITGTRAIRQDGGELTFRNALLRSLSRCVPFEVFSGFNSLTWHDSWTDTMVIKVR